MNAKFNPPDENRSTLLDAYYRERERNRRKLAGLIALTASATIVVFLLGMFITQADLMHRVFRTLAAV